MNKLQTCNIHNKKESFEEFLLVIDNNRMIVKCEVKSEVSKYPLVKIGIDTQLILAKYDMF